MSDLLRFGPDGKRSLVKTKTITGDGKPVRAKVKTVGARGIPGTPMRYWSPNADLNKRIGPAPALDPNSASIAAVLGKSPSGVSIIGYGVPIYYATPDTPRVAVTGPNGPASALRLDKVGEWGPNPWQGLTIPMERHWVGSPGYPGRETTFDGALAIVDTDGRVHGLGKFRDGSNLTCRFGGWAWARSTDTVFTETGTSTGANFARLAGVIRRDELAAGVIDHALVFSSPHIRPGVVKAPATKTDGNYMHGAGVGATPQNSIPEAQRIQLDPSIDLDAIAGLTKFERIIGRALQAYGAYAIDNTGSTSPMQFICESPDPSLYTYDGGYGYAIKDPTYNSVGVNADGVTLSKLPWASLRILA